MRNFVGMTVLSALFVAAVCVMPQASAVERIEEPLTFRHALNWKSSEYLSLDRLDMEAIEAEDYLNTRKGRPVRVAISRHEKEHENYESRGEWSVIDDMSVWRLKVNADDAKWLGFAFENVFLPSGSSLYIYSEDREQVFGPYTDKDNKPSRKLWTPMVYGQNAYIELNVPTAVKQYLSFDLKNVSHGYRTLKSLATPKAGACNIDVVCPQGDDWRDEIRSVARYVFESNGGSFTCTGNLVNNANEDRKAYFMTASHCVSTISEVQSMVLFWNFEKSVCGGASDGSQAQSQSGATLLASVGSLDGPEPRRDMTLVELDSVPPESYNVHWSGWDASSVLPTSGVSIHHPDGTEKRISIDSGPIVITNFGSTQPNPNGTHLMIAAWDQGTTEGGSSGSGFWNSDKRIVGVLSGGGASCDTPDAPDFYAHLSSHYDVGTTSATRMKAWLDPQDTGITQVDGVDACSAPSVSFSINPNPAEVGQPVTFTSSVTGQAGPGTTYAWDFDADGSIDSTQASPVFTYSSSFIGNVSVTVTNTQSCSDSASAAIVVAPENGNSTPEAVAAAAQLVSGEGTMVGLDATSSSDPDGDALEFSWTQTAGPSASIVNSNTSTPTVTLPFVSADTVVSFTVEVSDIFGASDSDTVSITTTNVNRPPFAIVSNSTITVTEGGSVTLNAAASSDPDGDNLSINWSQTSGAVVTLNNAQTATATFTAPQVSSATNLTFEVQVVDSQGLTDTATVTVTVNDLAGSSTGTGSGSGDSGSGGGGAFGVFGLLLLFIAACIRRTSAILRPVLVVSVCGVLIACGTSETASDSATLPVESVNAQTSDLDNRVVFSKRGVESKSQTTLPSTTAQKLVTAFETRERRFEKIKPLFEYEIQISVDGDWQTWLVSPSGYVQKSKSYELYKMDVSTLADYMK